MTDLNPIPASPRAASLVANALNMQAIGGSIAIIYAAYMKRHGMTVEQDEFQAYSFHRRLNRTQPYGAFDRSACVYERDLR